MEKRKGSVGKALSAVYLVLAIGLLVGVCGYCYPQVGDYLRQTIAGAADGAVRQAFGVLADGLGDRLPVEEALKQSYEVLVGEANQN